MVWFYSGRRGVHCWVCDESARTLSNDARAAVATYFELPLENEEKSLGENAARSERDELRTTLFAAAVCGAGCYRRDPARSEVTS